MNEYRVTVAVRNNLILSAIEKAGYKSVMDFCKREGINHNHIYSLVNLEKPPINDDGEFSIGAKFLMETLCVAPSDLWTEKQLCMAIESRRSVTLSEGVLAELLCSNPASMVLPSPEDNYLIVDQRKTVEKILSDGLTEREQEVLRKRFWDERTLGDIGVDTDVQQERIRQIESKALRKLRHPKNADILRQVDFNNVSFAN